MQPIFTGDLGWLSLASLRAVIVALTALAVLRTSNSPHEWPFSFIGTLGILGAFCFRFAHSIVNETHPYLTWDLLVLNLSLCVLLCGILRVTSKTGDGEGGGRRRRSYIRLSNFQRRVALVLGILIMAFTVNLEGVQWFFGFLGLGLMLLYLLPGDKPEEDKNV